jgi:hypothetical protein
MQNNSIIWMVSIHYNDTEVYRCSAEMNKSERRHFTEMFQKYVGYSWARIHFMPIEDASIEDIVCMDPKTKTAKELWEYLCNNTFKAIETEHSFINFEVGAPTWRFNGYVFFKVSNMKEGVRITRELINNYWISPEKIRCGNNCLFISELDAYYIYYVTKEYNYIDQCKWQRAKERILKEEQQLQDRKKSMYL